jgi:hypothetical protein
MKNLLLATVIGVAALASPASAAVTVATTTSGTNPASDPGYAANLALIYDFDALSPAPGNLTGDYKIETAPGVNGVSAAPAGTPAGTKFLTVPNSTSNGSATLKLGGSYKYVSFYWGSIDDYNTLELLDAGGNLLYSVTGSGLPAPTAANGNQSAPTSNRRVTFSSDAVNIAQLRLSSTNYAFEIDTVAAAVPEPATWGLMIGGLGLVGFAARRRARQAVTYA